MLSNQQSVKFLCQLALFGLMFTTVLSASVPVHKHRRHVNRRLFMNSYFANVQQQQKQIGEGPVERAVVQHKDVRDLLMVRNKMRSLNLMNPMMLPDKTAQFKNGDARFYRINALASKQSKLRSTPFNESSIGSTMKKLFLRMN